MATTTEAAARCSIEDRLHALGLNETDAPWLDRYLLCNQLVDPEKAKIRQRFEAVATCVRDLVAERWLRSRRIQATHQPKWVYYLSMEFLLGRSLRNNLMNMRAERFFRTSLDRLGWDLDELLEEEPDAGLGNGGLGRLAACFMESLATMEYAAIGYGLRYEYGIFRQEIRGGWQTEAPDRWLRRIDPWEVTRPDKAYAVPLNATFELRGSHIMLIPNRPSRLIGIAHDRPVVGYEGCCVNTLRLWSAVAPERFDFADFSHGEFVGAVIENVAAESLTRVLYPDDSTERGRALRFLQQYFLVSCSLQDIVARARRVPDFGWDHLPRMAAVQLNDTHPALAVAELMRILLDDAGLDWDDAWEITRATLAYTNHTLLPEALEKWPVRFFEAFIPRHLEIIYEVNRRFIDDLRSRFGADDDRVRRMSLIEESPERKVRMAHLATVGTHSTNGVARIHSDLLRTRVMREFAEIYPQRFGNKTNGVTPRRWLAQANPALAGLITEAIGDGWISDLDRLSELRTLATDAGFRESFRRAKRQAKRDFTDWLRAAHGRTVDPGSIFDSQIKRIHEYKRQLMNALHIVILYNRIREYPAADVTPRTFFFAGKAAPAYNTAKLIVKLINCIGETLDADPLVRGRLRVVFLPDYSVTLAERLIPASDVSEQISTAGYEASGTGNMKFMMNGALTIGTRDGATIEMAEQAGEENLFLFGLSDEQVEQSRDWYDPTWHMANEEETRQAVELVLSDHFNGHEPGIFEPIREMLFDRRDRFMVLADLRAYTERHRDLAEVYNDADEWTRRAILNVGAAGRFSSDRTIREYARDIWNAEPSPIVHTAP